MDYGASPQRAYCDEASCRGRTRMVVLCKYGSQLADFRSPFRCFSELSTLGLEAAAVRDERHTNRRLQKYITEMCLANRYEGPFLPLIALRECDEFHFRNASVAGIDPIGEARCK